MSESTSRRQESPLGPEQAPKGFGSSAHYKGAEVWLQACEECRKAHKLDPTHPKPDGVEYENAHLTSYRNSRERFALVPVRQSKALQPPSAEPIGTSLVDGFGSIWS